MAKRCIGFETNVYVCDPFVSKKEIEDKMCIPIDKIEGIKLADYISIHFLGADSYAT